MQYSPDMLKKSPTVAYFCMEVGLSARIPTYSGGLGVLAGDTLRSAADLELPMVGVTLLHRQGYFRQHLDAQGNQTERPTRWHPETQLVELPVRVSVPISGRQVAARVWAFPVEGATGYVVPVYYLDTNLPENNLTDRHLTAQLYGGDNEYRLRQEALLGLGGVAALRALGHHNLSVFHMNEGHAALLTLALLEETMGQRGLAAATPADQAAVRRRCVFTTHTPVPAGHDSFDWELAARVLGPERAKALKTSGCCSSHELNMTHLALHFSRYINGVSELHAQVSRHMFPGYDIKAITNGVHAATWTSPAFQAVYDRHFPGWRANNSLLSQAMSIPLDEIRQAHAKAKARLVSLIKRASEQIFDPNAFTIGFARRATGYKRADLLFHNMGRLRHIARAYGPLQVVYGGKAHPRDEGGKEMIRRVYAAGAALEREIKVVYLEEYNIELAKVICPGVDLWLNTPIKPREASGTSGMKAALNGVPSLSVLDGWWAEGCQEGATGWGIPDHPERHDLEAAAMYDKLEQVILPQYCGDPEQFAGVMRGAIALNGPIFNTERMMRQYVAEAYCLGS